MADPYFCNRRPIDIILGENLYPQIILGAIRHNIFNCQKTRFGWIVTGSIKESSIQVYSTKVDITEEDILCRNILRFSELEEILIIESPVQVYSPNVEISVYSTKVEISEKDSLSKNILRVWEL